MRVRAPLPLQPSDIVWIQTSFLGDIILTTAAIKLAAQCFPKARQHLITTRLGVAALADFPYLATRIALDKTTAGTCTAFAAVKAELRQTISSGAQSVVLRPHRSFRSSLLAAYLAMPSIAYQETDLSFLASQRVPRVAVLHESTRIGLLLEPLGVTRQEIFNAKPFLTPLPLLPTVSWQAALLGLPKPWIAIAPGSVWATKRWGIAGYRDLAVDLLMKKNASVLLLGSQQERPLTTALMSELQAKVPPDRLACCLNLAGLSDLDDLRRVVPQLALLVSNDSSPIHYASAFNVPTLAVFGATIPEMGFGPLATRSLALGVELPCRPCSAHGPEVCPLTHFACMKTLSAATVIEAVDRLYPG